eukprot:364942-Chlamydomonas_euryale.AAC.22
MDGPTGRQLLRGDTQPPGEQPAPKLPMLFWQPICWAFKTRLPFHLAPRASLRAPRRTTIAHQDATSIPAKLHSTHTVQPDAKPASVLAAMQRWRQELRQEMGLPQASNLPGMGSLVRGAAGAGGLEVMAEADGEGEDAWTPCASPQGRVRRVCGGRKCGRDVCVAARAHGGRGGEGGGEKVVVANLALNFDCKWLAAGARISACCTDGSGISGGEGQE